jgi:glycine/D-amino acid oxidase-like deaminating enzyme
MNLPREAEFVVIGAGAIGCGVAYSLARAGKTDVVVLERAADVAQATTAQGAGFCGQVRSTVERTKLAMHSVATFRELQKDAEVRPNWHEVGSLRIALSPGRAEEFRQLHVVVAAAGLETALIDNQTASRHWPLLDFRAVQSVLWCPSDGYMTPYAVARSYEHQGRKLGVRFATATSVDDILCRNGRVVAVKTRHGLIDCRYVINAAGAHAYHVAKLAGLELPIVPVRHEYFVTVPLAGMHANLPCLRIPEMTLYVRARDGGLLLGGWEATALSTDPRRYPLAGTPPLLEPDWTVLGGFEERFAQLLPQVRGAGKACIAKGWPTFTPDGRFIIGESGRVKGFVMAGGCNAHGISGSAGIGRLVVQALFDPGPSEYLRSLSPDRFADGAWSWAEARQQAARVYETYYAS